MADKPLNCDYCNKPINVYGERLYKAKIEEYDITKNCEYKKALATKLNICEECYHKCHIGRICDRKNGCEH